MSNRVEDFLSQLNAANNTSEREWVILEYSLNTLTDSVRKAVWIAAIPHWFDKLFLEALMDKDGFQELIKVDGFSSLISLSYIESFPGNKYNVHERTRKLILEKLWEENKDIYKKISQQAFKYCQSQDQDDSNWEIELIYHMLIVDPQAGASRLQKTCIGWLTNPDFTVGDVESLLKKVQEHVTQGRFEKSAQYLAVGFVYKSLDNYLENNLDNYSQAKTMFEKALLLNKESGNILEVAENEFSLAEICKGLGEYEDARIYYVNSLEKFRKSGKSLEVANTLAELGDLHSILNDYASAIQIYDEALHIYQKIKDLAKSAEIYKNLGVIYEILRDHKSEVMSLNKALELFQELKILPEQAKLLRKLGDFYQEQEDFSTALKYYEKALLLYEENIDNSGQANIFWKLGQIYRDQTNYDKAQINFQKALKLYKLLDLKQQEYSVLIELGDLARQQENWSEADFYYNKALNFYMGNRDSRNVSLTYDRLGQNAKENGSINKAFFYYRLSRSAIIDMDSLQANVSNLEQRLNILVVEILKLGDAAFDKNFWSDAQLNYEDALNYFTEMGRKIDIAIVCQKLGLVAENMDNIVLALNIIEKFLEK